MPSTMPLDDSQLNIPTGNRAVDELLRVIKATTKVDFQVIVTTHRKKVGLFRRRREPVFQTVQLYRYVGGIFPWQLVDDAYDYPTIIAYLEGFIVGVYESENESRV